MTGKGLPPNGEESMRRRDILARRRARGRQRPGFPAPAIAQGSGELTMVTDWPEAPGMLPSARRLAQTDRAASNADASPSRSFGLRRRGAPAGDLRRRAGRRRRHVPFAHRLFRKKSPAFHFFSGVPFGFTANELFAWVRFGGGQALWDELAGQFDIKPLLCCSTGAQMGGWFGTPRSTRRRRSGACATAWPGSAPRSIAGSAPIVVCCRRRDRAGAAVRRHRRLRMGRPLARHRHGPAPGAGYYYYPGWHEPGTALALGINRRVWESFERSDRQLIEAAAAGEYAVSLAEFNANNAAALSRLRAEGAVKTCGGSTTPC
jgi:hypothetical protein